jgi:hypothetical protein
MQASSSFLGKKEAAAEACKFVFDFSSSDDSLAQLLIEEKQTKEERNPWLLIRKIW